MQNKKNSMKYKVFNFENGSTAVPDKNSFLYELALKRGKDRGWYPQTWTIKDYMKHLFNRNIESVF